MADHSHEDGAQTLLVELMAGSAVQDMMSSPWDPLASKDWDKEKPTEQCFSKN